MARPIALGLGVNRGQFALLVLINGFVGAMVGLERAVLPVLGSTEFGLETRRAILGFIVAFGVTKAFANLLAGRFSERMGRRPVLLAGWLAALPVPPLLFWAPRWEWVLFANALLGVNQGLAWSMTVTMKIDLVGPWRRGLAMGLNEFAGYVAVALAALTSGWLAAAQGIRPALLTLGLGFAVTGFVLSMAFVRETSHHAELEAALGSVVPVAAAGRRRGLAGAAQAGFVNNLNDAVAWGLLPLWLAALGAGLPAIAAVAALYPALWGILQVGTGALSDRWGRRPLIVSGMLLQGGAFGIFVAGRTLPGWLAAAAALGIGTALVYPTLLAAVGDVVPPHRRARAVGAYRFWRDLGYAAGALGGGLLADAAGLPATLLAVALLTVTSGLLAALLYPPPRTPVSATPA